MPLTRLLLCFALLIGSPGPLTSQSAAATPQRDPQALDLLARCSAAMGSPALGTTFSASGKLVPAHPDDPTSQLVVKSKGGNAIRWDMNSPAAQETVTMQPGRGKIRRDFQETPMAPWQTLYTRAEHFPALLCGTELQRPNMEIAYLGLQNVGDIAAHHIQISVAGKGKSKRADEADRIISEFHIYLDAQSFVVLKTKRYAFSPDAIENRSDLESYYSKYGLVGGVLMPFAITKVLAGQKLEDILFDSIELNVPLSDAEFN